MFTKTGEIVLRNNEDGTMDIGKTYVYADDLDPVDIVRIMEQSDDEIRYVDVSADDDYAYGAGRYSIPEFYANCSGALLMIGSLGFDVPRINARILFHPEERKATLVFHRVKEVPAIEADGIIGSACKSNGKGGKEMGI